MRRNLLIFFSGIFLLLFTAPFSYLLADNFVVKSLHVYSSQDQKSFPLIDYSDNTRKSLTIDFDVDGDFFPAFSILFKFCDSDWNPYESAFLKDPLSNTERNLWFETLPVSVKGARYHYRGDFPNKNVQFTFSGKWMFFIIDSQSNTVYESGKFFVIRPEVKLKSGWAKESSDVSTSDINALNRTIALNTSFILPDTLFQLYVKKVEIINNRRLGYPVVVDRNRFTGNTFYQWNGANEFIFTARNLKPGNEYRETDTRNYNVYNTPTVSARFGDIETSNLFTQLHRDMNGGFHLVDYKDPYADYMYVQFKLRVPENFDSRVFLVGSFNNWEVLPEYEMYNNKGLFDLTVELKRGVYDYQYVTGNVIDNKVVNIDWQILEGNFWETENEYYIFLYYSTVEKGGYDKIIGYTKITTGAL